jgi:hypothetical protein
MNAFRSTLQITLRHGIWRTWLDGKFFGDYRSKANALAGAAVQQRAMASAGKIVGIVVKSEPFLA